jgi:hypothetical protein
MTPEAQYQPSSIGQHLVVAPITCDVRRDLGAPPFGVRFRFRGVQGAPVPEAAVDEDRDSQVREDDVWTHQRDPSDCPVNAIPKPTSMEGTAKTHLIIGISATNRLHPSPNERVRYFVWRCLTTACR